MKPNFQDEVADRAAEERSEDDGMAEHPAKVHSPERWATERHERERQARTGRRTPERGAGSTGIFGIATLSCAVLAALTFWRRAVRRMGAGIRLIGAQGRFP
jgi:hypothetical protein